MSIHASKSATWAIAIVGLLAVIVLASSTQAAPVVTRFEVAGVAQVLRATSGGYLGGVVAGTGIGYKYDLVTPANDRIYWGDTGGSGFSYFWLDPSLYGNLGSAPDASTGSALNYNPASQVYGGTVTGNTPVYINSYCPAWAFVPDTNSMFNHTNSGNGGQVDEIQAATTVGGADVVGEGTNASKVNTARMLSSANPDLTTGDFHTGLAYLGSDATNYKFLFIDHIGGTGQEGKTVTLTKSYATAPTATTAGTRTSSIIGGTVTAAELNGLVPTDAADYVWGVANDSSGNIWVVSANGTHNYLSEFSLAGGFNQIDLNPGSGNLFIDLAGLIRDSGNTTDVAANGIAVNADASKIYISAGTNIFIFDNAPVPEPATLAFLAVGGVGMIGAAIRRRK